MKETLQELGEYISVALPAEIDAFEERHEQLILHVSPESLLRVTSFLHDDANCLFRMLIDVAGVDYPNRPKRFEVVYQLLSTKHNQRVRVKVAVNDDELVPSVIENYPAAGWYEREVWDMYGVMFSGNPDLRRILTDYGFDGHPQRKDFPLTGYVEMRYDEAQKRVIYEPVELTQAYRSFDYLSPWEGMVNYEDADKQQGDTA